ncbi:MAG: hypothetical protein JWM78_454 [Verrucomicrobiaceae bacterium]|nr:hypothetical protein [Verrucomicrobiaceae bacterium]
MKSIEWIDRVISERKLPSDRQAALLIGMTPQLISKHRNGNVVTLDDENAYSIEKILGLPHGRIVADQHAERSKNPEISAMWRKLAATAAVLFLCTAIFPKAQAEQLVIKTPAIMNIGVFENTLNAYVICNILTIAKKNAACSYFY